MKDVKKMLEELLEEHKKQTQKIRSAIREVDKFTMKFESLVGDVVVTKKKWGEYDDTTW